MAATFPGICKTLKLYGALYVNDARDVSTVPSDTTVVIINILKVAHFGWATAELKILLPDSETL